MKTDASARGASAAFPEDPAVRESEFGNLNDIYATLHPILFHVNRLGTISAFSSL
jgi:hypothetical protein